MNNRYAGISPRSGLKRGGIGSGVIVFLVGAIFMWSACSSPKGDPLPPGVAPDQQMLNVGDTIKIAFPGTPGMGEVQQQIRRDGRINLTIIGEVKASDKTPAELEKELEQAYATHLTSKEIKVTVLSSAFYVFVTGAVMKPGKVGAERVLTALDAIMEAGGFDNARANTKIVRVIRQEGGQMKTFVLNMKNVLEGKGNEPFYLRTHDIIVVPEKITWF